MATRRELVAAIGERYRAPAASKSKVLDEFVAVNGVNRNHAMPILHKPAPAGRTSRTEHRIYTEAMDCPNRVMGSERSPVRQEVAAAIADLIETMECHGHLDLDATISRSCDR